MFSPTLHSDCLSKAIELLKEAQQTLAECEHHQQELLNEKQDLEKTLLDLRNEKNVVEEIAVKTVQISQEDDATTSSNHDLPALDDPTLDDTSLVVESSSGEVNEAGMDWSSTTCGDWSSTTCGGDDDATKCDEEASNPSIQEDSQLQIDEDAPLLSQATGNSFSPRNFFAARANKKAAYRRLSSPKKWRRMSRSRRLRSILLC
mmetsp:Transcript_16794/g.24837  ORF Transcript_16794/g.24837 Transcript_16794/m.24837 type:complete len:204 (-) Transcript_16794:54-665(-)